MDFTVSEHAAAAIVERVMVQPQIMEDDRNDPTLKHALATIPERDGRVLRVVFNFTKNPPRIVTVYFDRTMKGTL